MIRVKIYHMACFVSTENSVDVERVKALPYRMFMIDKKIWWCPPIKRNLELLESWEAEIEDLRTCHATIPIPLEQFTKTKPMLQQFRALGQMIWHDSFALFMEPGLGKSKVLIDDAVYHHHTKCVDRFMVVCPNSITGNWVDELSIHCAVPYTLFVWQEGNVKKAERWIASLGQQLAIMIMPVESLSTSKAYEVAKDFLLGDDSTLAVDESSTVKTFDAKRTKHVIDLARHAEYRRIATGTPATKGNHELWSQFQILDPLIFGIGYYPFRAMFCRMGGFEKRQVVGNKNQDILVEVMGPHVITATKQEYLTELPPKTYQVRKVGITDEMSKAYRQILAEHSHALVRDLRLHQLLGGFVVTEQAVKSLQALIEADPDKALEMLSSEAERLCYEVRPLGGKNPKLDELLQLVDEIPGKIVIWCRYIAEIELLVAHLSKIGKCVQFHGKIPQEERDQGRRAFQTEPDVRFFIGQIATGGIGITLHAASTAIYFSRSWSALQAIQSEDRIHRIGQSNACTYIDLVMDQGRYVDQKILDAIKKGTDYSAALYDALDNN